MLYPARCIGIKAHIFLASDFKKGQDISIPSSNLPTLRDNIFDGALGAKVRLWKVVALGNVIVPLNDGGLRSQTLWTFGLQASF